MTDVNHQSRDPKPRSTVGPDWAKSLVVKADTVVAAQRQAADERDRAQAAEAEVRRQQAEEEHRTRLSEAKHNGAELAKQLREVIISGLETASAKGRLKIEFPLELNISQEFNIMHWPLSEVTQTYLESFRSELLKFLKRSKLSATLIRNTQPVREYVYDDPSKYPDGPSGDFRIVRTDRWYSLCVGLPAKADSSNPSLGTAAAAVMSDKSKAGKSNPNTESAFLREHWRYWEVRDGESHTDGRPSFEADHQNAGYGTKEKSASFDIYQDRDRWDIVSVRYFK